jgi:subtilisin family serine protease
VPFNSLPQLALLKQGRHILQARGRGLTFSLLPALALVVGLGAIPLHAQFDTAAIPHRYIVVYRNTVIPGDVEVRARSVGASVLRRNERFGLTVIDAASATDTDDAKTMRAFAAQPDVEFVVHDRMIYASAITLRPAIHPSFSVVLGPVRVVQTPVPPPIVPPVVLPAVPPSDTFYNSPQGWAVRQVGGYGDNVPGGPAHGPWDTTRGKGIRIAILDSGIDPNHPDIAPNLAFNLSEIDQTALPSPCDDGGPQDQTGHGTWTASLAAGAQGPGTGDVIGVAPSATLLNIKVLQRMPATGLGGVGGSNRGAQCAGGQAGGLLSWVIQGIEDAMANHADIISMSLGVTVDLTTGEGAGLKAAMDRVTYAASQAGIVLIGAAGNDGYDLSNPRFIELPAQARNVLSIVASTNPDCAQNTAALATCVPGPISLAYYSNFGAPLNALAAPGGSYPMGEDTAISGWIRGACSSGKPATLDGPPVDAFHSYGCFNLGHTDYVQAMGTSAATPLAAGVAALLRAAHPDWSAAQVIASLRSTAVQLPGAPVGQIDASLAIAAKPSGQL